MRALQFKRFKEELETLKTMDSFRRIPEVSAQNVIDLSTNSYLNLETNLEIEESARELCSKFSGNLASRLVSSSTNLFTVLEDEICEWKSVESSLVFNSGYSANVGLMQALANKNTVIFSDRLNHASIVDGIILSRGKMVRYRHNDMTHLRLELEKYPTKEKIIVSDSLFSMDGDIANICELVNLSHEFGALLIIDEAHSSGVFGEFGEGLVSSLNIKNDNIITIGTFSKAIGGFGGFFAGPNIIREKLINSARSFIFSTALPETVLAYNIAAIRYIKSHKNLGENLLNMASKLRDLFTGLGYNTGSSSTQIIPLITGSRRSAVALSKKLRDLSIIAPAIRPPTVEEGKCRVRISLNSSIDEEKLSEIIEIFKEIKL